jgi:hypothetical protein
MRSISSVARPVGALRAQVLCMTCASGQFCSVSGQCFAGIGVVRDLCVRSMLLARPVVFDRWSAESTVEI